MKVKPPRSVRFGPFPFTTEQNSVRLPFQRREMAKRKEIGDEDFSYPPGPKIRRLDHQIPPSTRHFAFNFSPSDESINGDGGRPSIDLMMDESEILPPPASSSSDDRSIVLYNPSDTILNYTPVQSNSSIVVSPELVQCLKNQVFHQGNIRSLEDKSLVRDDSLAVVPWVPPLATQITTNYPTSHRIQQLNQWLVQQQGPTESEEEEDSLMEIETKPIDTSIYAGNGGHEGFYHHCMTPEARLNSANSLMPSR